MCPLVNHYLLISLTLKNIYYYPMSNTGKLKSFLLISKSLIEIFFCPTIRTQSVLRVGLGYLIIANCHELERLLLVACGHVWDETE